jgi:hypothetical protein
MLQRSWGSYREPAQKTNRKCEKLQGRGNHKTLQSRSMGIPEEEAEMGITAVNVFTKQDYSQRAGSQVTHNTSSPQRFQVDLQNTKAQENIRKRPTAQVTRDPNEYREILRDS